MEVGFNLINLDYLFQEDDPLSPWIEEREGPLLDGIQNSKWLPIINIDNEDMAGGDDDDDDAGSNNENHGGLSPPSNNSRSGGGDAEAKKSDDGGNNDEHRQNDPYQEVPYNQ